VSGRRREEEDEMGNKKEKTEMNIMVFYSFGLPFEVVCQTGLQNSFTFLERKAACEVENKENSFNSEVKLCQKRSNS
jgi:hypothetical protein